MSETPLLYYRTKEQLENYCKIPVDQKIRKMEMEMELVNAMRQGREQMHPVDRPATTIEFLQKKILQALNPIRIYLFGSHATNTSSKESDIDLLLVMNSELPQHKRNIMVKRLFPHRSFALDAFVYTPQEFQRYKDIPGTVVYQAAHHGTLLYG